MQYVEKLLDCKLLTIPDKHMAVSVHEIDDYRWQTVPTYL